MSLTAVRPFFRTRLDGLGYTEHTDAFDDLNRERTRLDKMYRIDSGDVTAGPANQSVHSFVASVTLEITLRGGRNNVELVDRAFEVVEEVHADILQESVRIGTVIKNIEPGSVSVSAYDAADDNDVLVSMDFGVQIYCQF